MQTLLGLKYQPPYLEGVASTKQGKEGWATPEGQNAKRGPLKNRSLRCASGLRSSLTQEEAKLLANLYHGLIKDLPRGNNSKAKFKKPKILCNNLTLIERIRERHLMISLHLNNLS